MHISTQIKSFTYLGGKFSILPWLLEHLPTSNHFVDVFGGSAVVLLNRPISPIETYNDINERVVNFFKVLRDNSEELITALELTPHSRKEYYNSWDDENCTAVERARRFFVRTTQSIFAAGSQEETKGWCIATTQSRCQISEKTNKILKSVENLHRVATRLRQVQIDCRDFRFVLDAYDTPETLFYCDSPYIKSLRSNTNYEFDFEHQDHIELHHYASRVKGKIAISGYKDPFMMELFKDFHFTEGPHRKNSLSKKIAIECLWTNYDPKNEKTKVVGKNDEKRAL